MYAALVASVHNEIVVFESVIYVTKLATRQLFTAR